MIDTSENIIETEVEINVDALPASAKPYLTKNYPGNKIKEATKITNEKGVLTYEAEVNGTDLIFDNAGNFLKTEIMNKIRLLFVLISIITTSAIHQNKGFGIGLSQNF